MVQLFNGPLQWYYMFGILQHGPKSPVELKFRPQIDYRIFYHTVDVIYTLPNMKQPIKRREFDSVEKIVALKPKTIHLINSKVKLHPENETEMGVLMKRPYFDRLIEDEVPGDFRSRLHPYGYQWMLFPAPESLMIPDEKFYQGQKWAVRMIGHSYIIHYELIDVDLEQHQATIQGTNGTCTMDSAGKKTWNATWIVDTRTGIIKQMELQLDHQIDQPKQTTRLKRTKIMTREEADPDKIYDYEVDVDEDHPDL